MRDDVSDGDLVNVAGLDVHDLLSDDYQSSLVRALKRILRADDDVRAAFNSSI